MLHSTKAIVIRTTKYGETSIITNLFTELLGVQTYIINGIRSSNKNGGTKANIFALGNILQIVAYAHQQKNMNRLKEYEFSYIYKSSNQNIIKNAILVFCIELIGKCIQEPAPMPEVFYLLQLTCMHIDALEKTQEAYNIPHVFCLLLANELGFKIQGKYLENNTLLNITDGIFENNFNNTTQHCTPTMSQSICNLNSVDIINSNTAKLLDGRKKVLEKILLYLQIHIPQVQNMRSPEVLHSIFE